MKKKTNSPGDGRHRTAHRGPGGRVSRSKSYDGNNKNITSLCAQCTFLLSLLVRIAMVIIMTVIKIIIIYVTAIYARAENAGWRVSRVLMFIPTPTPPAPPPPVHSSSTYFPPTLPNRITICGATDGRHREFYDVRHRRRQHCAAAADHITLLLLL